MNSQLRKRAGLRPVKDLRTDLQTGEVLAQLIEIICKYQGRERREGREGREGKGREGRKGSQKEEGRKAWKGRQGGERIDLRHW